MKSVCKFAVVSVTLFTLNACMTIPEPTGFVADSMPEVFRRDGMISSSSYQVYVTTSADTEEKAMINGEALARSVMLELLMNESFARVRISEYGKKRLINLIKESGKIVRTAHLEKSKWGISYQINRIGLREYLQTIR